MFSNKKKIAMEQTWNAIKKSQALKSQRNCGYYSLARWQNILVIRVNLDPLVL